MKSRGFWLILMVMAVGLGLFVSGCKKEGAQKGSDGGTMNQQGTQHRTDGGTTGTGSTGAAKQHGMTGGGTTGGATGGGTTTQPSGR